MPFGTDADVFRCKKEQRTMAWLAGAGVMLWLGATAPGATESPNVTIMVKHRQWSADAKKDPQHAGLVWFERRVHVDNAHLWLKSATDPTSRRPVIRAYGDFFFGLSFGGFGNGGWNRWDFLRVVSAYGRGKGVDVTHTRRHLGAYVLERRQRGVVEFAWQMPPVPGSKTPPGEMHVRLVKRRDEPEWLYLRVSVDPAHEARVQQLSVSSYPGQTSGAGVRRRVASTATRNQAMPQGALALELPDEYAVSLHNVNAHEYDACLLVFDPKEIKAASVAGTYCVVAALTPAPGRQAVHLAMGYFHKTHYPKGNQAFSRRRVSDSNVCAA